MGCLVSENNVSLALQFLSCHSSTFFVCLLTQVDYKVSTCGVLFSLDV